MKMTALFRKILPGFLTDPLFVRLALSVLSIIFFAVSLAGLSLYQSKRQHEKQVIISTENLSQVLSENIQHVLDKTDSVLLAMADEIHRQTVSGGVNEQALNTFIARQKERLQFADSLRMADEKGMVRYGTAVVPALKINIADRDHFTRPRNNPAPLFFVSKPVVTRIDKKWALPVSRRLNKPDGSFAGVVYSNIELKTFIDMFSSLSIGQNGAVTVCDQESKIIVRYPEPGGLGSTIGSKSATPQMLKMIQTVGKSGTLHARSTVDNIERIFSFREISSYPLYIIVARATSEYLSAWRQEVIKTGLIVLLFIVVILFLSWQILVWWSRERRVREELYVINDELEKRVAERTHEISNANDQLQTELTERKRAEDQILSLLAEKELLLKEVNHRIKNNMNVVMGFLSLQSDTLKDPAAVAALQDSRNRVQSMMVLYEKLYRSNDFRAISAKEYITALISEIMVNFPNRESVDVKTRVDDIVLDAKILSPVGIIINELLTNAMKHAFADRDSGRMAVSFSIKGDHATLIAEDNGIGIPESVNIETSTGFGLQLVNILAEQLEGSLRIERRDGTRFVLTFGV